MGVQVTGGSGLLLLTPAGIAAKVTGTIGLTPALQSKISFAAGAVLTVEMNNLIGRVNETVGGQPLVLKAGPFFRVTAKNINITVGGSFQLTADVAVDRVLSFGPNKVKDTPTTVTPDDVMITRIAFSNVTIGTNQSTSERHEPRFYQRLGAIVVIYRDGVAGQLFGTVSSPSGTSPAASASSSTRRPGPGHRGAHPGRRNTEVVLKALAAQAPVKFVVQNLDFNFGDFLEIRAGEFAIDSNGSFTGTVRSCSSARVPPRIPTARQIPARSAYSSPAP